MHDLSNTCYHQEISPFNLWESQPLLSKLDVDVLQKVRLLAYFSYNLLIV